MLPIDGSANWRVDSDGGAVVSVVDSPSVGCVAVVGTPLSSGLGRLAAMTLATGHITATTFFASPYG